MPTVHARRRHAPPGDPGLPLRQAIWSELAVRGYGVQVHYQFSGDSADVHSRVEELTNLLLELGVRSIRDRIRVYSNEAEPRGNQRIWWPQLAAGGCRVHTTIGKADQMELANTVPDIKAELQTQYGSSVPDIFASFGGPNEINTAGVTSWWTKAETHQRRIWEQLKAEWPTVLVCGPNLHDHNGSDAQKAEWWGDLGNTGISAFMDAGDYHRYPGGIAPSFLQDQRIGWARLAAPVPMPLFNTEGGYNGGVGITTSGNPIPEDVAAAYAPRHVLEVHSRGVIRFYRYQLMDDPDAGGPTAWESWFGFVGTPSLDPGTWVQKPEFHTMRRWISLLGEAAGWDAPTHTPQPLPCTITGGGSDFRSRLYQKSTGRWYLCLWRDVTLYDYDKSSGTGARIAIDPVTVTVNLGITRTVRTYIPTQGGIQFPAQPVATAATSSVDVDVAGELVILEVD